MRKRIVVTTLLPCCLAGMLMPLGFGQIQSGAGLIQDNPQTATRAPLPRFGIEVSAGTLGAGIQVATAVARHTNIRGGFNYFSYSLSGTDSNNNLGYSGKVRPESGEILVDQYLAGPFHISGGALVYDGFQATGNVHVPGGNSFTLNDVTYYSSAADPVTGTGTIGVRKIAPEFLRVRQPAAAEHPSLHRKYGYRSRLSGISDYDAESFRQHVRDCYRGMRYYRLQPSRAG